MLKGKSNEYLTGLTQHLIAEKENETEKDIVDTLAA